MNWFYKMKNKFRILIAISLWGLMAIFAVATSGFLDNEIYGVIISVIGCALLAVSIFFTVFAVKARKREQVAVKKQQDAAADSKVSTLNSNTTDQEPPAVSFSIDIHRIKNENTTYSDDINTVYNFGKWIGVNGSADQLKRLKRACLAENTPIEIITEEARGVFSGAHGIYNTTLEACTCIDFQRRKLPCKHMYRLAIELGLIDCEAQTDKSCIISPNAPGLSFTAAVDKVEQLSLNGQKVLREILLDFAFRGKDIHKKIAGCDYSEVLNSGLVEETPDGIITVDELKGEQRNLCIYLGRRNEDEDYYDPVKEEFVSFPKGAQHYATIDIGLGVSSSEFGISFPDDKITAELDKRGLNRCHAYNASRRK